MLFETPAWVNTAKDVGGVLFHPGLLIMFCMVVLLDVAGYLKKKSMIDERAKLIIQVLIVIGAIGVIGWKIHNAIAPIPQEPVKKRLVLLDGEGERW
ncbi:hypothetical protein D3C85_179260 [compost metagenome]